MKSGSVPGLISRDTAMLSLVRVACENQRTTYLLKLKTMDAKDDTFLSDGCKATNFNLLLKISHKEGINLIAVITYKA